MITVREIRSKADKRRFFQFPIQLYKNNPYFVPSLISEEMKDFDPLHNGAFDYCSCKLFLAYENGRIVGRIAAILNNAYNYKTGERQLRFNRFDFIDDFRVSEALFEKVREWAKFLGMNQIVGPIGFSDMDREGMLIEGFDQLSMYVTMYVTMYNYPYYLAHMEHLGLSKKVDWQEFLIKVPEQMDLRLERTAQMAMTRYGYRIKHIAKVKDLKGIFPEALKVMNEAYAHLYGVVPISEKQLSDFMDLLLSICDLDYITAVESKDGDLLGYGVMAPSIGRAIQKGRGKMSLAVILTLMRTLKHPKMLDMYQIAVKPEYQNKGVNAIIMYNCLKNTLRNGIQYIETGPELETNVQVQGQWKLFEHRCHKRRRCYMVDVN